MTSRRSWSKLSVRAVNVVGISDGRPGVGVGVGVGPGGVGAGVGVGAAT